MVHHYDSLPRAAYCQICFREVRGEGLPEGWTVRLDRYRVERAVCDRCQDLELPVPARAGGRRSRRK